MKLGVIGGSASTDIFMRPGVTPWPLLLADCTGGFDEVITRQQGMLTIARSLPLAAELPEVDVLLLSFATTLGWPRISPKLSNLLVPDFQAETAFHLAPYRSRTWQNRLKKRAKRLALNTVKYLAFPLGLYRPTNNLRDLEDQVRALVSIAAAKSSRVVWVQHRPIRDSRIWLERMMFDRYYELLMQILAKVEEPKLRVFEFPEEFMVQANFLLDEVHLSEEGHRRLAEHLCEQAALRGD